MKDLKNITSNTTEWILSYLKNSDSFKCQLFDILTNEDELSKEECNTVVNNIENLLKQQGYRCCRNTSNCQFIIEKE